MKYPAKTDKGRNRQEAGHYNQRLELIICERWCEPWISHDERRRRDDYEPIMRGLLLLCMLV